jgi:hypothetical protein
MFMTMFVALSTCAAGPIFYQSSIGHSNHAKHLADYWHDFNDNFEFQVGRDMQHASSFIFLRRSG